MRTQRWLISWIGNADHECAEGKRGDEAGPIASALLGEGRFDRVHLLTNYPHQRSKQYCKWLEKRTGYADANVWLSEVELTSPIDYASIYQAVSLELTNARLPDQNIELTYHLSPGTPAMGAIWIILSKTRFPAKLIQTSTQHGLENVDFPFDLAGDFLPEFLRRSSQRIERLVTAGNESAPEFEKIAHGSQVMRRQIELARRIAVHEVPVLILGETGTGKELFAEAIHAASPRASKPLLAVNCGAIPRDLANAELFGHKKGAFTGASSDRKGYFQEAEGGTLFLDEVGDLPLDSQVRLLRALQAREVTPVGSSRPVRVDVRILAATHRDLIVDVAEGRFREDLFHRLAVGILRLPPLREREGDVTILIDRFMESINSDSRGRPEWQEKTVSAEAKKILIGYAWPGNIRELYHTLLRAAIWSQGPLISAEGIHAALLQLKRNEDAVLGQPLGQGFDLQGVLDNVARDYVARALQRSGNRKSQAAKLLGMANYQTLGNWMKRLGIEMNEATD